MATTFSPPEELVMLCASCQKVLPAQLDRSIAGNGRTINKDATFEYACSKCGKTTCLSGNDLIQESGESEEEKEPREYSPDGHFLLGESIFHTKFGDTGLVVSKYSGTPGRILVQFEKGGLMKLVEGVQ